MTQQTPLTNEELWILVLRYEHLIQLLLEQINDNTAKNSHAHVPGLKTSENVAD